MDQSWYEKLFGVPESDDYDTARDNFNLDRSSGILTSIANGARFQSGQFSTPTLAQVRRLAKEHTQSLEQTEIPGQVAFGFDHIVQEDVLTEHAKYPGALFQAASQFNCLEFSNSRVTPEMGVSCYEYDYTQGPACALACAPGTIVRNYFVDVASLAATEDGVSQREPNQRLPDQRRTSQAQGQSTGQREHLQINNLDELERVVHNRTERYFHVRNGYTFSDEKSLARLTRVILGSKEEKGAYEALLDSVKVGLHENVGVTFRSRFDEVVEGITVTQVYCSALSCAYSGVHKDHWAVFSQLVLDACYEATMWAGVLNALSGMGPADNRHDVFISFIGGGAFGNDPQWICRAIGRSLAIMRRRNAPIRVHICHYQEMNQSYVKCIHDAYQSALQLMA